MRVVAVVSGGMDSVTLLYKLLAEGHEVYVISFDYAQRHRKELDCLDKVIAKLRGERSGLRDWRVADLSSIGQLFMYGSSQTSTDVKVPHGHYAEESMKATVVPNRNMVMLSVAIAWAVALGARAVAYGAHAGDHAIYPDCREVFVDGMKIVAAVCHYYPILLEAPFVELTKDKIAALGAAVNVPFELTWSCYEGGDVHCGKCGTCVERREAFKLAKLPDPTVYAS